jgi:cell division protein FtsB
MAFSPNNFPALLDAYKKQATEIESLKAEVARLTEQIELLGGSPPVMTEEEENDDA